MSHFPKLHQPWADLIGAIGRRPVAVIGHLRPDGDCIGSQVGLVRLMRALGIPAIAINPDRIPRNLEEFVGDTPFRAPATALPEDHLVVTADCADSARIGVKLRDGAGEVLGVVDHHVSNPGFGRFNLIDHNAAATAEILAGLAADLNLPLDPVAAQALYVGIATDTGQFRFPSTTRRVFQLSEFLMGCGADPAAAAAALYENESPAKLRLLQRFLASLAFAAAGRICIGVLTEADFAETGAAREDTEGLVDYARSIDGVEVGVLIEDRQGVIKGSLRAKDPLRRVDRIAGRFGGGGHACAAGFNLGPASWSEFRPQLIAALESTF